MITAAALLMSISFAALISADVSFMRMFGVGLTIAVLVDATLVRALLVPAFMHVFGSLNWWAPQPLAAMHRRIFAGETGEAGEAGAVGEAVGRSERPTASYRVSAAALLRQLRTASRTM
ncbi:MMPL family protein [Mycobacterium kansasii]|uniref:MMPL family protein n=1 Tax=Mycobacterium kansasii TaxID=1768 RepID=A0A1V3X672_MYCKA|nr:MMPL family protein [Mycobacterium kansasii]